MLPISDNIIKGSVGVKSTHLKMQILLKKVIRNTIILLFFIVVPNSLNNCIMGYDTVKVFKLKNEMVAVPCRNAVTNINEYSSLKIGSYENPAKISN